MANKKSNQNKKQNKFQLQPCKKLVVLLDKLSNCVFDAEVNDLGAVIEDHRLNIETPVDINFVKDENGNNVELDIFDKLTLSGAISNLLSNNEVISINRLFHTIGGGERLDKAPKLKTAIEKSLSKLRRTEITVDITELAKHFKKYAEQIDVEPDSNERIILKGALLPSETICATINGKVVAGAIHFLGEPIFLRIAKMKGQFTFCNLNLIVSPVRTTENTLKIRYYLLEHILKIKGSNDPKRNKRVRKLNNSILFDTIFSYCGIDGADTRRTTKYRKIIAQILDHFVAEKFISGYKLVKDGKKFHSIEVFFEQ